MASADEGDERGLGLSLHAQQPSIIVASMRHAAANPTAAGSRLRAEPPPPDVATLPSG